MTENKPIMINGKKYNECTGCELYNGYTCTGAKTYEPSNKEHKLICNEHMAEQFWVVFKQLARKTQECEKLKERFKKFHDRKLDESADLLCKLHKEECLKFKAEQKLKRIRDYIYSNTDFDKDDSIQSKTAGYDILQIIDAVE